MEEKEFENFLLSFAGAEKKENFQPKINAFFADEKMFALIYSSSKPLKISLRTDSQLAKTLTEKYEEVLPGQNLNKNWITIICSGQLEKEEILDLARLSYRLSLE